MTLKKFELPYQPLSARQSEIIATILHAYVGSDRAIATRHNALPLYRGWTLTIAIRPDGRMLAWDDAGELKDEPVETIFIRASLVRAAALDSELTALIPKRPDDALVCDMCCGTGVIQAPNLAALHVGCQCGGVGWLDSNKI